MMVLNTFFQVFFVVKISDKNSNFFFVLFNCIYINKLATVLYVF